MNDLFALYNLVGINPSGKENSPHYVGINQYKIEDGRIYLLYWIAMGIVVTTILIRTIIK